MPKETKTGKNPANKQEKPTEAQPHSHNKAVL